MSQVSTNGAIMTESNDHLATEHVPCRGNDVEKWIKHFRDSYNRNSGVWIALDDLLDDYRLHADLGAPLDRYVEEM
jgi:hypothetical protein